MRIFSEWRAQAFGEFSVWGDRFGKWYQVNRQCYRDGPPFASQSLSVFATFKQAPVIFPVAIGPDHREEASGARSTNYPPPLLGDVSVAVRYDYDLGIDFTFTLSIRISPL
jgi:hypothetical protein